MAMEVPHRIAVKMTPFFTETELEVAVILNELTELLRDPGDRPPDRPPDLRWGARRPRLLPRRRSSAAAIPEDDPSPSTSLPHLDDDDDETKGDAAAAAVAGSPSSPLSFPASGGEEPVSRPRPPPPPPPPPPPTPNTPATKPSSKNSKHPNERIKELRDMVASLSAERAILQQDIEQYKTYCTILKSRNSQLIDHRSKLLENQNQMASPAPSTVGAPPTERWPAKRNAEFDLNKFPEEEAAAAEAEAAEAAAVAAAEAEAEAAAAAERSARKAAISAEARRRRMEIQRAKSAAAAVAAAMAPGSMPSTAHKMPRLR